MSGLLRGGGWGFLLATIKVAPGFFHRKLEEKKGAKKNFLAVLFSVYLLYLPGNLKF